MKNNFLKIILILVLSLSFFNKALSSDEFIFNVTEIEVTDEGNVYKGINKGKITTANKIEITSDTFEYFKKNNQLESYGNAQILDTKNNIKINADKIIYLKNEEIIYTVGKTLINVSDRYNVEGYDLKLLRNKMILSSLKRTTITDTVDKNTYKLNQFEYSINQEILKGKKIEVITSIQKNIEEENNPSLVKEYKKFIPSIKSDNYFYDSGFFNFKDKTFSAKDTNLLFHKTVFDNDKNDPRLKSVTSYGDEFNTYFKKGVFTSCKKTDKCPPWKIKSKEIKHDKIKKRITYTQSWLSIYDVPVVYFPKFFHPDPSVKRQSGFLKPALGGDKDLGSSIYVPYFLVISDNKDLTIKPRWFDSEKRIFQSEYRQKTKKSLIIADFSIAKGHHSSVTDRNDSRSHFFMNSKTDLDLDNFLASTFEINLQKATNDTYLKKFKLESPLLLGSTSELHSSVELDLAHENYDFITSMEVYENLSGDNNNRYQHIFPSYGFSKNFGLDDIQGGSFSFSSSGSNRLNNTNVLSTSISNNLNFNSYNSFFENGIKSNYNFLFKNLNSLGKKSKVYKSSPQSEIVSSYILNMSLPLSKNTENSYNTLEPKISFRFNPHDMKDHSDSGRKINASNVFNNDRLSLDDTYEGGESITLGINYKKQKLTNTDTINENIKTFDDYLDFKLATVFRSNELNEIPTTSTIGKKRSNLFGQINFKPSEILSLDYKLSINDDLNEIESNSIDAELSFSNFSTTMSFLEERRALGKTNVLSNTFKYNFNEENFLSFNTRRNRRIGLTEYYDLVYEYKNDCLEAKVRYKKDYYSDRDIIPKEELFFEITIVPLTTFSPDKMILNKNRID
ncbi:LPS-assembly protein LptD [Candidatus Pelagibacter sp. Uisw_090]|uniref:LPS-assembly protein LptD n=1 Tax=Candidatus Pelagibacter sp. Uisw_090 TaxID=3230993 RepID=UPI0039E96A1F